MAVCCKVEHGAGFAGLFFGSTETRDLSDYLNGVLTFDIKVINEGVNTAGFVMKADCVYPCSSGDKAVGVVGLDGWETVEFPVIDLVLGGLNLQSVNTGLVIFPVAGPDRRRGVPAGQYRMEGATQRCGG